MSNNRNFKIWAGQGGSGTITLKELFRDFEGDKQLNSTNPTYRLGPNLSFNRPTNATFYSSTSSIETIASGTPRFEYSRDGTTFKGLLIEDLRTNIVEYSTNFTTDTWLRAASSDGPGVSFETNVPAVTAPDGTVTATKMYMNPARGYRSVTWVETPYPPGEAELGDVYTRSIFIKRDTARYIAIGCDGFPSTNIENTTNIFDFENPGFNDNSGFQMFWEYLRDGWYRVGIFRGSNNINTNKLTISFSPTRTNTVNYLYPDTTISPTASSVFIWGAQVEKGSGPTSYIPTSGTQVTRAADKVFALRNDFLNFYNTVSSSIFVKGSRNYPLNGTYLSISNLSKGVYVKLNGQTEPVYTNALEVSTANLNQNTFIYYDLINHTTQPQLLTVGLANNNIVYYQNQQLVALSTTNVSVPVGVNNFYIGSVEGNSQFLNGHILKLHYWPDRLENSTLSSIS